MKRSIILTALLAAMIMGASIASADTPAREAMITYSGTETFTKLEPTERQACVSWLVKGGTMDEDCSKAVMKLVAEAPDAVSAEQRQALIAEASGEKIGSASVPNTASTTTEEKPKISKSNDDTGKIVAIGLLGLLAGLVIHNNVRHHKSAPSYRPEPPRPAPRNMPQPDRRPPQHIGVPQGHRPGNVRNNPPQNVGGPQRRIPQPRAAR